MTRDTDRILPGVALMIAFCVTAPLIDVSSKLAAATVSVGTIVLLRGVVQGALMLPLLRLMGLDLRLPRRAAALAALRAAMLVASTYCFVAALRHMAVADALAIAFVEPFVILLIARFALGEQVGPRRLGACLVGFAGSLMVIRPAFDAVGPVALFPLGTAVAFAIYILVTRSLSRELHPVAMQFHTSTLAAAICLPLLALGSGIGEASLSFTLPQGYAWLWCFCVGLASAVSHMAMTYALRFAPSATLAPLHYLEIISAVGFGYLVFGDFPDSMTWAGIAVIVSSGLYIIHRERQLSRQPAPAPLSPHADAAPAGSPAPAAPRN